MAIVKKTYGIPYMGSKSQIAPWVISKLPAAETFVDLFAGGCAITHAAMLSGKWHSFVCNDITDAPKLFCDGVAGKYRNEKRWISREDFERLKDTDPYVRLIWSFGNNQSDYMYAQEIEGYKRAFHEAAVFNDYTTFNRMKIYPPKFPDKDIGSRKLKLGAWLKNNSAQVKARYIKWWLEQVELLKRDYERIYGYVLQGVDISAKREIEAERLRSVLLTALKKSGLTQAEVGRRLNTQMQGHYFGKSQWEFPTYNEYKKMQTFMPLLQDYYELTRYYTTLQSLQRLQSLQSLERLERLQRLQSLQSLQSNYTDVIIPDNSTVYADPPYRNTQGYLCDFDFDAFDEWLRNAPFPVFVSEYSMPRDFRRIAATNKRAIFSLGKDGNRKDAIESIFVHEKWFEKVKQANL
jgi:site-specific DNA-adenine methylase